MGMARNIPARNYVSLKGKLGAEENRLSRSRSQYVDVGLARKGLVFIENEFLRGAVTLSMQKLYCCETYG